MATFSVRPCRPEDESEAREVDVLATADLRRAYRPTQAALARRASLRAALTRLVALADTRVVGVVDYWKDGDRLAFLGLGVHPDFRRRGVARALVRDLERIGSDSGCQALGLHTVRQTGNVRIFERLGFMSSQRLERRCSRATCSPSFQRSLW
jgi:ribosomal protein S18 acetylase RimI-like enzyme